MGASGSGQSARAVTVAADPKLAEGVQRFLANLDWFGMADLQFWLQDDGEALLTDFNGRIYGALALPVAAGWNGADAWGRLAMGQAVELPPAPAGVRYHSMEGELRQAVARRRPGEAVGCLVHAAATHHPVWQTRDPMPGLGYIADKVRRLVSGEMDLSGR